VSRLRARRNDRDAACPCGVNDFAETDELILLPRPNEVLIAVVPDQATEVVSEFAEGCHEGDVEDGRMTE
jgi:hypothetical protein